jgi:hypothetical protein
MVERVITQMLIAVVVAVLSASATARKAESSTMTVSDSVAVAVYEGRTPCGRIANEFTGFPSQNCEKVKWQLTFYRDVQSGRPRAFLYEGTRTSRRGTWSVQRGTPFDADAQVYRLTPQSGGKVISLLSIDEKVLLLLDETMNVLPGDASWSYAFNRTDRKLSPVK